VSEEATYWDYSSEQDTCPVCGDPKRKVSTRCQDCDAAFRARVRENLKEYLKGVQDHKNGKKVVLRFIFD
jgi:hypothetical protein